uniref:Hm86 protein n=1 Tax=Hyalomma marginatum marginatum TaxID=127000 RepID=E5D587_9ACAR|nr:Hm86 protein [Hyalomma marginatum marginatum]
MGSPALFVAAILLIVGCAGQVLYAQPTSSICSDFGKQFCQSAECEAIPGTEDDFVCKCPRDDMYYNAAEKQCEYKRTCKTVECSYGYCVQTGAGTTGCGCEGVDTLTLKCGIPEWFANDCGRRGGTAVRRTDGFLGARCDCGEWGKMSKGEDGKCVPTTCIRPDLTCKDLCEKNLLGKDTRCCQGWNSTDCPVVPQEDTYCSPGSIKGEDGKCIDACTTKEALLLCKDGCIKGQKPGKAYKCICPHGYETAEDGITCKRVSGIVDCTEEQKAACLPGQQCRVHKKNSVCECPPDQQLLDGKCASECVDNRCHENFTDCGVYMNKQGCYCPWTRRKPPRRVEISRCVLNEFYYTVSFTPNISLNSDHCEWYEKRVLEAIRTAIGAEVFKVEILNCTQDIKARLIASKPLSKYVLKKLQACEHPVGDFCMLYPKLPIKKGSAAGIEEENLCESLLKNQEKAYKGENKCVRVDDFYWFQCADGYRAVDEVTRGRLRRSVCKAGVSCTDKEQLDCANKGQICVFENEKPNCQCPPGTVPGQAGCAARTTCNPKEIRECEDKKKECVYRDQKAECKCPEGTVDDGEGCSGVPVEASCPEESIAACRSNGQRCAIENGRPVCKETSDVATAEATTTEATKAHPDPGKSGGVAVKATTLLLLAASVAAAAA